MTRTAPARQVMRYAATRRHVSERRSDVRLLQLLQPVGRPLGIASVEVVPDRRRRGLGLVVMTALLRWGPSQAAERAYLQVSAENVAARQLYSRLGFTTNYQLLPQPVR